MAQDLSFWADHSKTLRHEFVQESSFWKTAWGFLITAGRAPWTTHSLSQCGFWHVLDIKLSPF